MKPCDHCGQPPGKHSTFEHEGKIWCQGCAREHGIPRFEPISEADAKLLSREPSPLRILVPVTIEEE